MYAFIDGKFFQVYLNGAERARAAQHSTYGAYRQPGKGRLSTGYVKPKAGSLRQNSGVKGVLLHMGIGGGGVVTVREAKADGMARLAAKRATICYPGKRKLTILADKTTQQATSPPRASRRKVSAAWESWPSQREPRFVRHGLRNLERNQQAPPQARSQVAQAAPGESGGIRCSLKRAAKRLPRAFLQNSIGGVVGRCERLYTAKGHFFEEGG